jgi:hypothetical protein
LSLQSVGFGLIDFEVNKTLVEPKIRIFPDYFAYNDGLQCIFPGAWRATCIPNASAEAGDSVGDGFTIWDPVHKITISNLYRVGFQLADYTIQNSHNDFLVPCRDISIDYP